MNYCFLKLISFLVLATVKGLIITNEQSSDLSSFFSSELIQNKMFETRYSEITSKKDLNFEINDISLNKIKIGSASYGSTLYRKDKVYVKDLELSFDSRYQFDLGGSSSNNRGDLRLSVIIDLVEFLVKDNKTIKQPVVQSCKVTPNNVLASITESRFNEDLAMIIVSQENIVSSICENLVCGTLKKQIKNFLMQKKEEIN